MSIRKIFFDWSRPALRVAAGYLAETYGTASTLDLEQVIVAVPGARAGRRLLQALVEFAATQNLTLVPPRIVTAGNLPELLYEIKRPLTGDLAQQLAWVRALQATRPKELTRLIKRLPERADLAGWLALGQMLAQLHCELAADGLDFAHVLERGARIDGFRETQRWKLLADLQQRYLRILDGLELWDRQTARLYAIEHRLCHTDSQIVLLATVDMDRAQRAMLDQVAERVTALVFAAQAIQDRFDEHGCLLAPAWRDMPIAVEREQIEIVAGPAEQADAVIRAMAAWQGAYSAEEISIGVPDERVVPYLDQRLTEAGASARFGAGTALARSAPYQLLAAVSELLDAARYRGLAALLRHPDVNVWLERRGLPEGYLTALDQYFCAHLPSATADTWLGEAQDTQSVQQAAAAVGQLTQGLAGPSRPLGEWSQPILDLLIEVYGHRELDREHDADRRVLTACEAVAECLDDFRRVDPHLMPETSGGEALRLVLDRVGSTRVAPPARPGTVEMLGWLELPLDDAPALIVTGLNEGLVPASRNGDLFLPDRLRTALEMEDNDRRYARDNYALSVLAASRARLKLIAARRTSDGDPLAPSRLLFACDEDELAPRAKAFFSAAGDAPRTVLPQRCRPGRRQTELPIPRPRPLTRPIDSLRVTQFRDYLACPYRFYLKHCLRLDALEDLAEELSAAQFGSLLHEVLKRFGQSPLVDCTDGLLLRRSLDELLAECLAQDYGAAVLPAVRIQAEQVRLRLAAFAQWQARRRADGWRIHLTEKDIGDRQAFLSVDGDKTWLRGRIDRVDVHERDGRMVVFDYKTSDTAKLPGPAHCDRQGQWIDLQLPLYRHLLQALEIDVPVQLGYIALPKDVQNTGEHLAEWTPADLAAADLAAADVIRKIRSETFWPPSQDPRAACPEFAAICQDDLFGAASLAAADDELDGDA